MAEEEAEIPQEGEGSFMFPDRSTYTGSWKLNADGVKMWTKRACVILRLTTRINSLS